MYVVLFCFSNRLERADWGFKTPDLPREHDAMRLRFQVYVTLWHFMGHGGKFSVFSFTCYDCFVSVTLERSQKRDSRNCSPKRIDKGKSKMFCNMGWGKELEGLVNNLDFENTCCHFPGRSWRE